MSTFLGIAIAAVSLVLSRPSPGCSSGRPGRTARRIAPSRDDSGFADALGWDADLTQAHGGGVILAAPAVSG
jgi:hypothetical protein